MKFFMSFGACLLKQLSPEMCFVLLIESFAIEIFWLEAGRWPVLAASAHCLDPSIRLYLSMHRARLHNYCSFCLRFFLFRTRASSSSASSARANFRVNFRGGKIVTFRRYTKNAAPKMRANNQAGGIFSSFHHSLMCWLDGMRRIKSF